MSKLPFFLLLIWVAFFSLSKISDYDIFCHIKEGEVLFQQRALPNQDLFSFTRAGAPLPMVDWLSKLLFYLVYRMAGFYGLSWLQVGLVSAIFSGLYQLCRRRGLAASLVPCILIPIFMISEFRLLLRPHLVSYLFMIGLLLLLDFLRDRPGRLLLWLLPFGVIWANFYSGCVFGLLIIALWSFAQLVERGAKYWGPAQITRDSSQFWRQAVILILLPFSTLLATLLNPNGSRFLSKIYHHINLSGQIPIVEHQGTTLSAFPGFYAALAIVSLTSLVALKQKRLFDLLLLSCFGYLASQRLRLIPDGMIIAGPIMASNLVQLGQYLKPRWRQTFQRINLARREMVGLILLALLAFGSGAHLYFQKLPQQNPLYAWGPGWHERLYPAGALDFLDTHRIMGNLYNSYHFGSYIIFREYPRRKVFFDGRAELFIDLYQECTHQPPEVILERYGIDIALLAFPEGKFFKNGPNRNFESYFLGSPDWAMVYWDDTALLYLRRTPQFQPVIESFGYRLLRPYEISRAAIAEIANTPARQAELFVEIERSIAAAPSSATARLLLGNFYQATQPHLAIEAYRAGLTLDPGNFQLWHQLGGVLMQLGQHLNAWDAFQEAFRIWPDSYALNHNLGILSWANGEFHEAARYFRHALEIQPGNQLTQEYLGKVQRQETWRETENQPEISRKNGGAK
jgi:Flp pilus assembly protein TadD